MSYSVPLARANALPWLTASALVLGLVILLPLPANAAEVRLVGDVVSKGVERSVSTVVGDLEVRGLVKEDVHSAFGDILVSGGGEVRGDVKAGIRGRRR